MNEFFEKKIEISITNSSSPAGSEPRSESNSDHVDENFLYNLEELTNETLTLNPDSETLNQIDEITYLMPRQLDYESNHIIRQQIIKIIQLYPHNTIILNFSAMDFVGSSGIGPLVDTLKFAKREARSLRIENLKSEFIKVFKLYQFEQEEILQNLDGAQNTQMEIQVHQDEMEQSNDLETNLAGNEGNEGDEGDEIKDYQLNAEEDSLLELEEEKLIDKFQFKPQLPSSPN
jgi:anti-sigma B factor antagonist